MNKNAYIQIALTSNSFCQSAWNAFTLILKNAHRFGFTATIGALFLFFGVFFISAVTGGSVYLFLTNYPALMLSSPIPTTIVCSFIAMIIGW